MEARSLAFYGAWLGGTVLGAAGTALHHKLCHILGGAFNLPRSETHTVLLPHVTAYNAGAAPDADGANRAGPRWKGGRKVRRGGTARTRSVDGHAAIAETLGMKQEASIMPPSSPLRAPLQSTAADERKNSGAARRRIRRTSAASVECVIV